MATNQDASSAAACAWTREAELACTNCPLDCSDHLAIPDGMHVQIERDVTLAETVKEYTRHVVVLVSSEHHKWAKKVEEEADSFMQKLDAEITRQNHSCKLTAAEMNVSGDYNYGTDVCEVLVFPEMVQYCKVKEGELELLVNSIFAETTENQNTSFIEATEKHQQPLFTCKKLDKKAYVLVCCHKRRDKRCGVIGPLLVQQMTASLRERGLTEEVEVFKSSHTGGHAWAGNVIIYPGGHWYGRVTPCHVPLVIDKHILEGTIIRPLYRGCMPQQQQQQQSSISSIAKNSENDKHGGIVAALAAEETLAVAAARREKEGGGAESNKETRANLQW